MRKKLMAVILSCLMLVTLVVSSAWTPMRAAAVTMDEMTSVAVELIRKSEGTYGSINPNDNGAVSVGILQWHADRALQLMRTVASQDSNAQSILGTSFYNEVMTASSWNYRTFSSSEASAASKLLSTDIGIAAQESLAASDVAGYIRSGQSYGITDAAVLVYYAEIYNRGSGVAARILRAANTNGYENITLDQLHQAALANSSSYYTSRLMNAYNTLSALNWGNVTTATEPQEEEEPVELLTSSTAISAATVDQNGDMTTAQATITIAETPADFSGDYAGDYVVDASSLNVRCAPATDAEKIGTVADGQTVAVTAANGNWAEIVYGDSSGYCAMDYLVAEAAESVEAPQDETPAETTTAETTTAETTTTTETTTVTTTTETTTTTVATVQAQVPVAGVADPDYATVYGDINGDGQVDMSDAVLLQHYLDGYVLLDNRQLANSDCDRDDLLNTVDVTVIVQFAMDKLTALPVV